MVVLFAENISENLGANEVEKPKLLLNKA